METEHETVPEGYGCDCGEMRIDWLIWSDDGEVITCATCGNSYTLAME